MHGAGGWYTSMRVYDVSVAHTFTYPHWAISPWLLCHEHCDPAHP